MAIAKTSTKSLESCIISQLNTRVGVHFHVQVNVASCHTKLEVNQAEKLFNALKAIETLASGAMMVYGLHSVQAQILGQSINLNGFLILKKKKKTLVNLFLNTFFLNYSDLNTY